MKRRDFLGAALAGLAAMPQASAQMNSAGRQIFPMNRNWLYGGRAVEGASEPNFDDSRFTRVTLPHTNVMLPWHSFDDKDYEFVSIYRRHFRVPDSARGQRVFVDFEGAMTASTVNRQRAQIRGVQRRLHAVFVRDHAAYPLGRRQYAGGGARFEGTQRYSSVRR
jgi:hypothetical protein